MGGLFKVVKFFFGQSAEMIKEVFEDEFSSS